MMKKMIRDGFSLLFLLGALVPVVGQHVIEGYVYEKDNRGYLYQVNLNLKAQNDIVEKTMSHKDGYFSFDVDRDRKYIIEAVKPNFKVKVVEVSLNEGDKTFVKVELEREPGYFFEATLAPARSSDDVVVDAIRGARIEVYNHTKDIQELDLMDHPDPEFRFNLREGNHYTMMVRKEGYMTKRIEAYVNVEGCILCLDGVGSVNPDVADNLTEGNELGTLLANIELEPADIGSTFVIEDIYYDFDKSYIREDAAGKLDNLAVVLNDNPKVIVELGSHTDSRGKDKYNRKLSEERARSAVQYLVDHGVNGDRITSKGYGESQLTNRCSNGVECSEEEHQENRRTEIKIIGLKAEDEMQKKSLAQIIREEKFLRESFDAEQIYISDGDDIPEDLQKYLDEQKASGEMTSEELKEAQTRAVGQKSLYEIMPEDFSGYSVLLTDQVSNLKQLRSKMQIEETIYQYIEKGKEYYIMGEFRKLKSAMKLYESLKAELPGSDVIFFRKGKMIKK